MRSTIHFGLERVGFVLALAVLLSAGPLAAQGSAAEALGVADGIEQTILERLTPEQAEAFLAGADPATIVLEDGTTLEEFLLAGLIDTASQSVYHPLNQCVLVKTPAGLGGGKFAANDKRDYTARGRCGVAAEATAVVLNVKAYSAPSNGQVFVYPTGHTSMPSVINLQRNQAANNMVTVALGSTGDFTVKSSCPAHFVIHVVGYFAPLVLGPLNADTLDGLDATDFATKTELMGTTDLVSWNVLKNVPAGLDDGDDVGDPSVPQMQQDVCRLYNDTGQTSGPDYCCGDGLVESNLGESCDNALDPSPDCLDCALCSDNDLDGYHGSGPGCSQWPPPTDCYDANPNANPAQDEWFAVHRGDVSYDYDCDATQERRWPYSHGGCGIDCQLVTEGWVPMAIGPFRIPPCGFPGDWVKRCAEFFGECLGPVDTVPRIQECR